MEISCRVVIVDDELLVRQGIKHLLNWEQEGFQIVGEASNGKEALELIERVEPHIVITDIVMPVMGGEELTRAIKARYPEIEVIILSSYGEFDYVRSTFQSGVVDYILKPKLEAIQLLDTVKRTAQKIPSLKLMESTNEALSVKHIVEKLMSGYEIDVDDHVLAEAFPHNSYRLIGADLKSLNSMSRERYDDSYWVDKMKAVLSSECPQAVYFALPVEPNMATLLVNMDQSEQHSLVRAGRELAAWSGERLNEIGWTIGETFDDLRQLGSNYKNSFLKLNSYRYFLPSANRLIVHGELPKTSDEIDVFNMNQFTELLNRRQFDEAFGELLNYVNSCSSQYKTDVFEFKSFLGNVIFNITILLGRLDPAMKKLDETKYAYFKSIGESSHVNEAAAILQAFINEVNDVVQVRGAASSNPNMTLLLQFIRENYAEPLSLTEIAKHFHFNPSYLSSYFTAHNKEGFSEYLNKIRVEKAAELLQQDAASISEISGMVGYSDHSYFTKVFKKLTGLSPSHYRKQYLGKKRD